jgi:hypothetical protein
LRGPEEVGGKQMTSDKPEGGLPGTGSSPIPTRDTAAVAPHPSPRWALSGRSLAVRICHRLSVSAALPRHPAEM